MTLVEFIIALSLSAVVTATGLDLLSMGVRQQAFADQQTRVQADASLGWRAVEVELRQATEIDAPTRFLPATDTLAGCRNHDSRFGVGALDPSQPVTSFFFCVSGGDLYYYQNSGCPAVATCGDTGGLVVARGVSHLPGTISYFAFSSPANLVRFSFQTSAQTLSQTQSQAVDESIAVNAAAGTNQ